MLASEKSGIALLREIRSLFFSLIGKDRDYILIALVYGVAISALTLAVPVSVQMLINSVANTALVRAVVSLAVVLFALLLLYGALQALQSYVLERFERRFFTRMVAEFSLRIAFASHGHFAKINRAGLINRYFDVMQIQKVVTSLIAGLFSVVLQMIVGIILVSFYHPWLLVFNLVFIFTLWAIWRGWGYKALQAAVALSDSKYEVANHLEQMGARYKELGREELRESALKEADALSHRYMKHRKRFFRFSFSQQVALLLLYAVASAALLGIGGVLVVNFELTLGQLVAAELILSSVFLGISKVSVYFVQFYDLGAAVEEVARMFKVPLQGADQDTTPASASFNAGDHHDT